MMDGGEMMVCISFVEEAMELDKQSIDSHGTKVESDVTANEPRYQGVCPVVQW